MLVHELTTEATWLDAALEAERPRLVRLCALFTGDSTVAEDLAQETLITAWRMVDKLYDPQGLPQWLTAIARNICLRWRRRNGRELAHLYQPGYDSGAPLLDETLVDDANLEVELERSELTELLDRALALLPPETRTLLIQKYIEESPHAEIAARLGLSENTVAVRLHRGKLALKRVLTTELRSLIAPYGLVDSLADAWEETNIWCYSCGQHRLRGRFIREHGDFSLSCPSCFPEVHVEFGANIAHYVSTELFRGIKSYKPALTRFFTAAYAHMYPAVTSRVLPCPCCERPTPLHDTPSSYPAAAIRHIRGISFHCDQCDAMGTLGLYGLALASFEGQRFWREHPRIRTRPEQEIEVGGRPALLLGFEGVNDEARFDIVFARDTYEILTTSAGLSDPTLSRSSVRRLPIYGDGNLVGDSPT